MGLFEKKKKDAERCPICGKEISFFSGLVIADGTICDDCEKMVRGQFNIEEYYGRENWKISTSDPLKAMTVEELKDMINEKKAEAFWLSPRRLLSIAEAAISKVFPAPTSCASNVFPPYSTSVGSVWQ